MAQAHALSGQIVSVRPLGAQLRSTSSNAILKAGQLEVMRIVLLEGKSLPEHTTRGEATVQCIEGEMEFLGRDGTQRMHPGDFVHLEPCALRALTAVQDASLLVTLCLLPG
jgi:quercetin dioxygenase-like cupin family protein